MLLADVSEWQGPINWAAYATWSQAVIIRAYNGYRVDNYYQSHIQQARAQATIKVIGHYIYVSGSVDAAAQGHNFAQAVLASGGLRPGDFVALDIEEGAGDLSSRANACLAAVHAVLGEKAAQDFGYSTAGFWSAHLANFNNVTRWIAAYGQANAPVFGEQMWQFTDRQVVPGISNPCDCSIYNGTIDQLLTLIGADTTEDQVTPEQMTQLLNAIGAVGVEVGKAVAAVPDATALALRQLFTPGSELFGRVEQAANKSTEAETPKIVSAVVASQVGQVVTVLQQLIKALQSQNTVPPTVAS